MLVDLDQELNAAGIHLIFAELKRHIIENIERYGLLETIDRRHFYPTIEVAVEEFQREVQNKISFSLCPVGGVAAQRIQTELLGDCS